ncbi:dynein regulatory complex protein 11 isoform X2 [Pimephales promelas]|uniref:dynein regulatory complex protein 11 isoform X2 n=1 Tax=Pimephales promelas TaxID=90988 RepID=UPI0019559CCB|nr:dynein regulatory complex protein 11 isoform X2 [Pimephales promelas]KAG1973514.1 dynein regulatory complex protein [Pimephales promelas]
MSHSTHNKLWSEAHEELSCLLDQELPDEPLRPERDRVVFFQRIATLYVRYTQIFRKLDEAYDQSVHPQKRRAIRLVLEGVMGRVLELKNEMVEKEFSEYHYMDDIIQDLKLTPEDLEIPIPRYFIHERNKVLQDRERLFAATLNQMDVREKTVGNVMRMLTLERAIKVIQVAERARQGRLRAKFMREIHKDSERQKKADEQGSVSTDQAAVCIQKVWRGFMQRKMTKRRREEEMIFLGMAMDPNLSYPSQNELTAQNNKANWHITQEEHEDDYQKSIESVIYQLREVEGPEMKETMKDQIRQWFIECRDATGSFPDYPEEEDGGSALIFTEKTPEELAEELAAKEEDDANKKPMGKEEIKEKGKKGNVEDEEEEPGLKMLPSAFLADLKRECKTFSEVWKNRNESKNFSQRHELELIKEEKRKEIEVEIRKQVDELMRQELANWKLAVDKEKSGKGKGAAKKKKATKGGKKKKKDKDLTADRTTESLFEELVEQELLKKAENVKLKDYLGDYSYLGTTLRQSDIEPMPSLSDVRQVVALYAVLPLGSQAVHEKAPLVKSILLVGPSGVGKKMLVHAICQETGANLFDLSPLNVAGKYPGKSGLQMMLHLVFKVARLMQPSVIWIGDAEKMFYKKVPKDEKELDPKRLKKDLLKILKSIKGEDCVLIVGTTNDPHSADLKSLCKFYNKIILIPRPDYASRFVMWKELIKKNGGELTSVLDRSSLAKISDGYTQGRIVQVVRSILTKRRIQQLPKRPLTASEFVAPLARIDPVFQEEEEALKNWYAKTPLGKKRIKAALGKEGDEEPPKTGGKGGKKKGKK